MIPQLSILSWLKSNWKLILIVLLFGVSYWLYRSNKALKIDNSRISENFGQVTQDNKVLNLTIDEYKTLNIKSKYKLDSVMEVNRIKPKQVKSATIINTVYRDTIIEKIVYLPAKKQPNSSYEIPFSSDNGCVGVKGIISSIDPKSKIEITERTANNSIQMVVTKKHGILWWKKPEKYQGFSDCGDSINFTQINFIK